MPAQQTHWLAADLVAARVSGGWISHLREHAVADYVAQRLSDRGMILESNSGQARPFTLRMGSKTSHLRKRAAALLCMKLFEECVQTEFGERGLLETAALPKTWARIAESVVVSSYLLAPVPHRVKAWVRENLEHRADGAVLRSEITERLAQAVPASLADLGRHLTQALIDAGFRVVDRQVAPSPNNNFTKAGRAVFGIQWRVQSAVTPEPLVPAGASLFKTHV